MSDVTKPKFLPFVVVSLVIFNLVNFTETHAAVFDVDNASASAYALGWGVAAPEWSLDGTTFTGGGLGGWSLQAAPNADVRLESVATLGGGSTVLDSSGQSFRLSGGFYSPDGGTTWNGAYANAVRYLDPNGLSAGQSFSFQMAVNWRNGAKGVNLYDTAGVKVFGFNVAGDDYVVNDALSGNGSIGNAYSSNTLLDFRFDQTSLSGGNWTVTRSGGVTDVDTGTYSGVLRRVEFYAGASTSNVNNDALFFNHLVIGPSRNITFSVDMNAKINKGRFNPASGHGLELRGDFNNWEAGFPLSDSDNDGIYTASILWPGSLGAVVQYRMRATNTGGGGLEWEDIFAGSRYLATENRGFVLGADQEGQAIQLHFGDDDGIGPVISLNGQPTVNLQVNDIFTDEGATALDSLEGTCLVTASVDPTGTLATFTQVAGTYTITYNSLDAAGNSGTPATRTVVVASAANDGYDAFIAGKTTNSQTLAEYAFGATDVGVLPSGNNPQVSASGGRLILTYYVRITNPALVVIPELSRNLIDGFAPDASIDSAVIGQISVGNVLLEQRTASVPVDSDCKFLRLKIQRGQ